MTNRITNYSLRLAKILESHCWDNVECLSRDMLDIWQSQRQMFICGNGGSAANAMHMANDFLYGIGNGETNGMKVEALTANSSVLTCLANDEGYEDIFSIQLKTKASAGDLLLVLSGSGDSENIVRALQVGKNIGMVTYAIVGLSGGRCVGESQNVIHFSNADMQLAEDLQLIVGHMCMQALRMEH